ncbi:MAG: hypothetical protein QMD95_04040 [Candidatus Hodarchaeaceae archaeon]|nr:hypothetical protein [Candidatus Hodarchaeaceae archaeon]
MRKEMTTKLPWVAATLIIVIAAGLGAWALWPAVLPVEGPRWRLIQTWTLTPTVTELSYGWALAWAPDNSGIENIYFMDNAKTFSATENLSNHENIIRGRNNVKVVFGRDAGETTPTLKDNLWYRHNTDNFWKLVVAVTVYNTDVANLVPENVKVELIASAPLNISENKTGTGLNQFASDTTWRRWNAVWDNNGHGYALTAGESFDFTVKLWCWK